jgi:23S rRNA (uracil1939-C5)-methyltransferase
MATFFKPKRVHKKEYQTLTIDKHDHSGNGLCLNNQPIVVVSNALKGEKCEVKFTKQSKKVNFADVTKVLESSEQRVLPFCQYYGQCGGCSLQHTNAKNGLALKTQALQDYVAKNLNKSSNSIDPSVWDKPILSDIDYDSFSSLETGYRRRIRLAIDARNKSSVKIGFRSASSTKIVDIESCLVATRTINKCFSQIRTVLKQLPSISKVGHLVITQGDSHLQVALFVTHRLCEKSIGQLDQLALAVNCEVLVKSKHAEAIAFNSDVKGEQGTVTIEDKPHVSLRIKSDHFLQVNKAVNQRMISSVQEWLVPSRKDTLYDFFCGSGNFALSFADQVFAVKGFEGIDEMVQIATDNAQSIGRSNFQFSTMDLSSPDELKQLTFDENALVVLDPSREGAAALCQFLANSGVERIVYVSCNPNSFVRDAEFLLPNYRLDKIKALDMFPFTKHIELMALFIKQ